MVELYINNQAVVMPETFSIRLVRYNPLFNQKGDYSIPFSIPLSQNRHIINYADREETANYQKEAGFKLAINGIVRYQGTVVFRDPNPESDEISIYLKTNNSSFFSKIKDISLQEYDFGGEDNSGLSYEEGEDKWEDSLNNSYPDYPYVCAQINAPDLWEHFPVFQSIHHRNINEYDYQNEKMYRDDGQNWCQHMYVQYLINTIIRREGYYLNENDMEDIPDLINLVLVSMNTIFGFSDIEYRYNLPRLKIIDFFKALNILYAVVPIVNEKSNTVSLVMLSKVLNHSSISSSLDGSEVRHAIMKSEPPADGFLMTFESLSGDDYKYAKIKTDRSDAIEVENYSDLPSADASHENDLYYISSTERFYKCIEDPDNEGEYIWKEVGYLQDINKDNEEYKQKSQAEMILSDLYDRSVWRADPDNQVNFKAEEAKTSRKGNDMHNVINRGMEYNDFPFIFAFYRGLQALDLDDPYTIVTSSHNKTDDDLDSIWIDSNNNEWELTQVVDDAELKFIPYGHSESMPLGGFLEHYSGANNTEDIQVSDVEENPGIVNYPILSIDAYRYDNETEFSENAISNKWITSRGLYEKIHKVINHWETERKRKVIKYLAVPNRIFFDLDMTKKYRVSDQIFLINKLEMDITEKAHEEKVVKAELFTV